TNWPFSPTPEAGTAVWYGRFTPEKGAEYAILAARQAGWRLRLAGPIYNRSYFNEKVAPLLDDQITYVGHLSQAALSILVGNSAVGLVTSVWDEPFGLVYAEMLACGTPVAAFASGAAEEIIDRKCGVTVPKHDVAALAQVLGEVARKDRRECRRWIEVAFPVSRMVEGYEELYHSLTR
ncbi:MAG: glycosyltransferase, partial [Bacteroidota bacterium]